MSCLLDSNKVIGECLETAFGLKKYCYIIDAVSKDGFQATEGFQKTFNGYYKLQKRSAEWYQQYYKLFESQKTEALSFDALLIKMYECDGKIEVSFVSKLIASVDTSMPIWDQYVLKNLGLKKEWDKYNSKDYEKRISKAQNIYSKIKESYGTIISSTEGKECINRFHNELPNYRELISETKIIDFILWSKR